MNPALGLTEEIIERSTNEFLERANLKRSIISAPTPVSALEESYQEAWDGAETNAFVQACYQLATSRAEHRDELVELLELHATNLTAEPQFYPSCCHFSFDYSGSQISLSTKLRPVNLYPEKQSRNPACANQIYLASPLSVARHRFNERPIGNGNAAITKHRGLDLLREAWNIGVRVFDVGAHFGEGSSEEHLGQLIHEVSKQNTQAREELVIIGRAGIVSPNLRAEWERVKSIPSTTKHPSPTKGLHSV